MTQITINREFLLIVLTIIIPGLSHIYLGLFKKGIIILSIIIVLNIIPIGNLISIFIWIWQIFDLRAEIQKKRKEVDYKDNIVLDFDSINKIQCRFCGKSLTEKIFVCNDCENK